MEAYMTNGNKLNFFIEAFKEKQDDDGTVSWNDCLSIVNQILPDVSKTKTTELLYDGDKDGVGKIEFDDFIEVAKYLLEEKRNSPDENFDDEQDNQIQTKDFINKLSQHIYTVGSISKEIWEQLAQEYNIKYQ